MRSAAATIVLCFLLPAFWADNQAWKRGRSYRVDLGIIPIGGNPNDIDKFAATDCKREDNFSDCSAWDQDGIRYAIFDGAVSVVSAHRKEVSHRLRLPAGMMFGEKIDVSANKAGKFFLVHFDSSKSGDRTVYVSREDVRSSSGRLFTLELVGDSQGRLIEVVQRTDF
jgi:hypothetical protein